MKKLLFFVMAILSLTFFMNCKNSKNSDTTAKVESKIDSVPKQEHVPNQLVINFEHLPTNMAAFITSMAKLGIKLVGSCPCSEKLILLEGPPNVELHPDGEVATTAKNQGGNGTGVSYNFTIAPVSISKSDSVLVNRFPQPTKPKASVIMSIIDSGVDFDNAVLNPHLYYNKPKSIYCGKNYDGIYGLNMRYATNPLNTEANVEPKDEQGHGTFINGIIAGKASVYGVGRSVVERFTGGSEYIAIRQINVSFTPPKGIEGTLFDALCGIHYSLYKGAKVINASWGLVTKPNEIGQMMVFNTTLKELSNPKYDALLVASAGNDGIKLGFDGEGRLAWPAAFSQQQSISGQVLDFSKNIITVGAWNLSRNRIADFSNRGRTMVNLYAPGDDVLSVRLGNEPNCAREETNKRGTSFAAPFVSRTAAILRGLNPRLNAAEIKKTIMSTTETDPNESQVYGTPIQLLRHREAIAALPRR